MRYWFWAADFKDLNDINDLKVSRPEPLNSKRNKQSDNSTKNIIFAPS